MIENTPIKVFDPKLSSGNKSPSVFVPILPYVNIKQRVIEIIWSVTSITILHTNVSEIKYTRKYKFIMKHLTTILAAVLCAVCLSGCDKERIGRGNPDVIYSGQKWDVIKVNDSITVCLPGLNADSELSPVIINLHDPDCPCHKEGGEE